jgi:hypothetical protein
MTRLRPRRKALLFLSLLTACGEPSTGDPLPTSIPRGTYVEVMAELARLRRRPPPARGAPERSRLADSARAEILARHGVTAEQILEFADAAGRDPTLMMELSQSVAALSDSMDAELSPGNSESASPASGESPEPDRAARESPPKAGAVAADSSAHDPIQSPRFADPVVDSAPVLQSPEMNADSAELDGRAPERTRTGPVRRPTKSRPPG